MVRLVPMTENEFEAFLEKIVPEYAAENVRAGYWSAEEALEHSHKAHQNLLPQGVETEHNYLFRIQIEETGEKIGILWMKHEAPRPHGFIFYIMLDEEKRGKGYGKQAMLAIEEVAKGLGIETIVLHVFTHNPAAIQLYKGLGYEVTSQNMVKQWFFGKFRGRYPDLGVRACVRTLAPPNPAPFHTAKARRGLRRQILENRSN